MGRIDDILTDGQLQMLRADYNEDEMIQLLSSGIPGIDKRTTDFVTAIRRSFYGRETYFFPGGEQAMSAKDRERCLIAVLASRDAGLNLALHIYNGLMAELSPQEIADIIFLCGVYTGVDRISDGLWAEERTLQALKRIAVPPLLCSVGNVVPALVAAFRPPPPH